MKPSRPPAASRPITGRSIAFSVTGAYFAIHTVGNLLNGSKMSILDPDFIVYFNPRIYAAAWVILSALLLLYGSVSKRFVYGFTFLSAVAYAVCTTVYAGSDLLAYAMCGLAALMVFICGKAWAEEPSPKRTAHKPLSAASAKITVGVVALLVGGAALGVSLCAFDSYTTEPAMSTGTYLQMMDSLRRAFSFDTTLEFGETVSHMAAHVSPVFLVYLPVYALIPSPVTLLVLQMVAVFSAVIPLWLIARRHALSPAAAATLCGLLCLFPASLCGSVGSLHEYALLLPLLLWLFWALEAERRVLVWVFAFLTLCVRETAALHLFTVSVYWLICHRRSTEVTKGEHRLRRRQGWILLGVSVVYFTAAMILLSTVGKGTLITRFANVTGEYGFFFDSFFRELFNNPALALYEMLTIEKFGYVFLLLLPLGCLPLLTRKTATLIFLFPLLLLNLLADFPYHYNPDFPYGFGVTAFCFYLAVLSMEGKTESRDGARSVHRLLAVAVCSTLILVSYQFIGTAGYTDVLSYAVTEQEDISHMDALLDSIDPDASVSASGRLRPHLAARGEVYRLSHEVMTEYVVLDLREAWMQASEETYDVAYYEAKGYTVQEIRTGVGAVLRLTDNGIS